MSMSKPLVFFGTEEFSAASLKALISQGWSIGAVVTKPDFKRGRGQHLSQPAVKSIAKQHGLRVLQPDKLAVSEDIISDLGTDFGVLVAYGKLVPQTIIDMFPGGIINLHPSLLPKYRGPAPIEAAILNGDQKTGLSLMKLVSEMDAGPVYAQKEVDLNGHETQPELYARLAELGAEFLIDKLPDIVSGRLQPIDQDDSQASYTRLLTKQDGLLDLTKPAEVLERQVRAYAAWPRSRTEIFGRQIIIVKVRLVKEPSAGSLVLECNPGYLEILELIAPSGRTMSGQDYLRGYR